MADLIDIEIVNGIQIRMDPLTQRYQAEINGQRVYLKSLRELKKRCQATFDPVEIMVVRSEPNVDTGRYGVRQSSAVATHMVQGISEHSSARSFGGPAKTYSLQIADTGIYGGGRETPLSGDMYVFDADLRAELESIEAQGRIFLRELRERWRTTLAERGRQLRIEDLKRGKVDAPAEGGAS